MKEQYATVKNYKFAGATLLFLVMVVLLSFSCLAHDPIIIHNTLEISGNEIKFHNDGSYSILAGENNYEALVLKRVVLRNGNNNCTFGEFVFDISPNSGFDVIVSCEKQIAQLSVSDDFLSGSSQVANKVYDIDFNGNKQQYVGNGNFSFVVLDSGRQTNSIFYTYFKFGIHHILSGIDHVLFIICFLLIATNFISIVKNISGFTLSHSITLTLAATSILVLSSRIVEPIIAASIVVVALLAYFGFKDKHMNGFWIIFSFGLFHGLGFAGAISEVGFPKNGFVKSLIGFNLGVEAGQLLVVIVAYPVLYYLNKWNKDRLPINKTISLIIAIIATVWLFQRIFLI